eukprot:TRINITY_DN16259_c0_g1_i1.p1 TRINITY_DN16259_c0_g1~~TRINITY_DN16259_c0_g1_i1.p1  ORF type:complete len:281 (-),score=32.46 TRINITY_DN16259_c0_g1_i1:25-867(-)
MRAITECGAVQMACNCTVRNQTNMAKAPLLLLDLQGTLSRGAVTFGKEAQLRAALQSSGLRITNAEYWRIVEQTWEKCSRSPRPFSAALGEAIAKPDANAAAQRFVGLYTSACEIDPLWLPWIARAIEAHGATVVIATDHYAELSAVLLQQLSRDLPDIPAANLTLGTEPPRERLLVANSAFLGAHKSETAFWQGLRSATQCEAASAVLVDDFGFNELVELSDFGTSSASHREQAVRQAFAAGFSLTSLRVHPFRVLALDDSHAYAAAALAAQQSIWTPQ